MIDYLVYKRLNAVAAEIQTDHTASILFHDANIEKTLKINGITIPDFLKAEYENKRSIYPGEPLFIKAFKNVHYPFCLKEIGYVWRTTADSMS